MKNLNLAEIRNDHKKLSQFVNGREAVIVKTQISPRKSIPMVQYWTKEDIAKGFGFNSDRTKSTFITPLYA